MPPGFGTHLLSVSLPRIWCTPALCQPTPLCHLPQDLVHNCSLSASPRFGTPPPSISLHDSLVMLGTLVPVSGWALYNASSSGISSPSAGSENPSLRPMSVRCPLGRCWHSHSPAKLYPTQLSEACEVPGVTKTQERKLTAPCTDLAESPQLAKEEASFSPSPQPADSKDDSLSFPPQLPSRYQAARPGLIPQVLPSRGCRG